MRLSRLLVSLLICLLASVGLAVPASADVVAPLCTDISFYGESGQINIRTSPSRTVAWNIRMHDRTRNDGPWTVDVYVGRKRVDHKVQAYQPHGSINPVQLPPDSLVHIEAWHTDLLGTGMSSSRTDAPSRELARFLADELRSALPEGVDITADGPDVVVRFRGLESRNGMASILDEDDGRSFSERLETATLAVLSHVQDVAADASTTPWPGSETTLPLPGVEVSDGRLRAWFGDRGAPDLAVSEMAISRLGG